MAYFSAALLQVSEISDGSGIRGTWAKWAFFTASQFKTVQDTQPLTLSDERLSIQHIYQMRLSPPE